MLTDRCALFAGLGFAIAVAAPRARAQDIALGSHVRVFPRAAEQPSEGVLTALSPDSLSVRIGMSASSRTIPVDSVLAIDVGQGVRASHGAVLRDVAIGAAIGFGIVALGTQAWCANHHNSGDTCVTESYVLVGVPLAIGGALLGAHIGKNQKREQWKRVFDRGRGAMLIAGPAAHHGFAIGLSIPFGSGVSQP